MIEESCIRGYVAVEVAVVGVSQSYYSFKSLQYSDFILCENIIGIGAFLVDIVGSTLQVFLFQFDACREFVPVVKAEDALKSLVDVLSILTCFVIRLFFGGLPIVVC